jgi:hypothetical protein
MRVVQIEPGPTPTLTAVDAGVDEGLGTGAGRDVATDHLGMPGGRVGLDPPHHLEQEPGVAVGGVDDEDIDARLDQGRGALPGLTEVADGCADEESAVAVLGRVGELLGLHEVLDRDEAAQAALIVDERESLALVLAKERGGVLVADADLAGDERHVGHDVTHERGGPLGDRGEAEVAVGDDAQQVILRVDDGKTGDAIAATELVEVLEGRVRTDRHGVGDHAGLGALDEVDLIGLILDRQVAVQDAQSTDPGHGDGHPGLGDGVHRRRDDRHLEADLTRQSRGGVDLTGDDIGLTGLEQDVVVGQSQLGHERPRSEVGVESVEGGVQTQAHCPSLVRPQDTPNRSPRSSSMKRCRAAMTPVHARIGPHAASTMRGTCQLPVTASIAPTANGPAAARR